MYFNTKATTINKLTAQDLDEFCEYYSQEVAACVMSIHAGLQVIWRCRASAIRASCWDGGGPVRAGLLQILTGWPCWNIPSVSCILLRADVLYIQLMYQIAPDNSK